MDHVIRHTKRVVIGIVGGLIILIGIILIPYPGPGWLIVFGGLAFLATEFHFARRLLTNLRENYDQWVGHLRRQHGAVRLGVLLCTAAITVVTIWLVNGFGIAGSVLHVDISWLTSPFFT